MPVNTRTLLPACMALALLLLLTRCGDEARPTASRNTSEDLTSNRPASLTIGWLGIPTMIQFAAAEEKGWLRDELGVEIKYVRFTSGAPMLQAIAAGQVDIGYIGTGPALAAAHQGVPVKAVTANDQDALGLITTTKFAEVYARSGAAAAFSEFAKQEGRKLKIATVPRGTTPDVFLRLWLTNLGVDPERSVDIVPLGDEQLASAMIAGQVDAVLMNEPVLTMVHRSDSSRFKIVMWSDEIIPNLINTCVLVKQGLIDQYPDMVEKFVEIHTRANKLFKEDKEFWAQTASKWIGEEIMPLEAAREVVQSHGANLITNPRAVGQSILIYDKYLVNSGVYPVELSLEDIFDFRFYDRVVEKHPELRD